MTTEPSSPTLRESVDELSLRLTRIGAAASMLRSMAPQIRHGIPPTALVRLTQDLERDLVLASTQLDLVHERAALELSSLRDIPAALSGEPPDQPRRRRRTMWSTVLPPPRG